MTSGQVGADLAPLLHYPDVSCPEFHPLGNHDPCIFPIPQITSPRSVCFVTRRPVAISQNFSLESSTEMSFEGSTQSVLV